jgi:Tol biopolymer transport system component
VGDPGEHAWWRLSPDGKHVVLQRGQTPNGRPYLWTLDLASGTYARFGEGDRASWHPDNAGILFRTVDAITYRQLGTSSSESDWSVRVLSPMGSSFDSDGKHVAHTVFNSETSDDLAMISVEDRESRTLFVGPGSQQDPHFSPRGNWLAYSSDETGAMEVYAISYPGLDRVLQVSNSGGAGPLWRDDGAELFYLRSDGALMSVAVTDAGFGNPTRLFEAPAGTFTFGVTDGGQRFLFGVPTGESLESEIHVVLNWFEELKERVPTDP